MLIYIQECTLKKDFFVCDSYHTMSIAQTLQEKFPEATVFVDSTILSSGGSDAMLSLLNALTKTITEPEEVKQIPFEKVDFFILSAKLILDGSVSLEELKKNYGNTDSKVVAVSTMWEYLERCKNKVDITVDKDIFFTRSGSEKIADVLSLN